MRDEKAAPSGTAFFLASSNRRPVDFVVHHAMLNEELLAWLQKALSQGDNAFFVRCKGVFIRKWRI